jgi:Bifunctional DNA primase/polymerase, N-terminal
MTTRARAIADHLLAKGLSIFPVPPPEPGTPPHEPGDGKTPRLPWKPYQTMFATRALLERWFSTEQNIAIVTGALSGVVVLDADDQRAQQWVKHTLAITPWQTRTHRGRHFYFQHPGVPVHGTVHAETRDGKLALDVRGDGNYVIAPGSLHEKGHHYRAEGDWRRPRQDLPIFSPTWITRVPATKQPVTSPPPEGDLLDRARAYLAAIPIPEIGHGSDQAVLYAASRLVRGFSLSAMDAEDLLWAWCGDRPGWTRDWVAQKIQNAERYGTEPRGGLVR